MKTLSDKRFKENSVDYVFWEKDIKQLTLDNYEIIDKLAGKELI